VALHCKKSGESFDHLLLHCEVARELWNYIFKLFGAEWVMPKQFIDLLNSWDSLVGCSTIKEVWWLIPMRLMWCLWSERNGQHFEDIETSMVSTLKT
jgi:hypothetical protein